MKKISVLSLKKFPKKIFHATLSLDQIFGHNLVYLFSAVVFLHQQASIFQVDIFDSVFVGVARAVVFIAATAAAAATVFNLTKAIVVLK